MSDTDRDVLCELLIADDYDGPELRAAGFEAEEALSMVTRVRVASIVREQVDPEQLLGRAAGLRVDTGAAGARTFYGVITEAEVEPAQADVFIVQIEIHARIGLLALGRNTRLFQQSTIKKAVKTVLEEAGLIAGKDAADDDDDANNSGGSNGSGGSGAPPPDQVWAIQKKYPHKEYILQRGESDLDFVTRLLEEEGIGFAVHDGGDDLAKELVVFFDDSSKLDAITGDPVLLDRQTTRLTSDTVTDASEDFTVAPDSVMLRDYDFRRPGDRLNAVAPVMPDGQEGPLPPPVPNQPACEVYRHPGNFVESGADGDRAAQRETRHPKEPARLAQRALDQLRCETRVITGNSDCPRLETGRRFELSGNQRPGVDGELLIISASHRAFFPEGQDADKNLLAYENDFRAVPRPVPWRPAADAFPPGADGIELAFVTTPSGEEIHVDEFGRIKVRFPWDRSGKTDDSASVWMRVGQPAVGGGMILPRGGFEVVVDFERGDVDRPFITGHLYNQESPPPYELPAGKTVSTLQTATTANGGPGHELRFDDTKGGEEVYLRSSRDYHVTVANDSSHKVGGDQTVDVGNDSGVDVGGDHGGQVKISRKLDVGADQNINVGGNFSAAMGVDEKITASSLRKLQVGGDLSDETKKTLSRKVGGLQSVTGIRGVQRMIASASSVIVGGAWMELVGGDRTSEVGAMRAETIGGLKKVKAAQISTSAKAMTTQIAGVEDVKVMGNRSDESGAGLTFSSGGGVSVKATAIALEAADKLTITVGGSVIKLEKSGTVEISSPQVDLTGIEAIEQLLHSSN
jgi:type VI secretion system secreted protein VgrG